MILFKGECVKVLGKKKALELFYATEDIIENGGLLTLVSKKIIIKCQI